MVGGGGGFNKACMYIIQICNRDINWISLFMPCHPLISVVSIFSVRRGLAILPRNVPAHYCLQKVCVCVTAVAFQVWLQLQGNVFSVVGYSLPLGE
jgi:hypothetical protein